MTVPGVSVSIRWMSCGEINAYYTNIDKTVTLCEELLLVNNPGFLRFVLAHEMAHAIIMQKSIGFTGQHEVAADELAAVLLLVAGYDDDVVATGRQFVAFGGDDHWWDPHPGNLKRGATLLCLAASSRGEQGYIAIGERIARCDSSEWARKLTTWTGLLR